MPITHQAHFCALSISLAIPWYRPRFRNEEVAHLPARRGARRWALGGNGLQARRGDGRAGVGVEVRLCHRDRGGGRGAQERTSEEVQVVNCTLFDVLV